MRAMWVFLALAATAWPADWAADVTRFTPPALELRWDNGTRSYFLTNSNYAGNDFDITTISTRRTVNTIRIYTSPGPNNVWDGMRYHIFNFAGGFPGSRLWGPYFYRPSGPSGWYNVPVNWVLPIGVNKFLATAERYYNYPNCDAYAVDDNPTFLGHSWGDNGPLEGYPPYRNLMLRVVVEGDNAAVRPTSFGRVKALYK